MRRSHERLPDHRPSQHLSRSASGVCEIILDSRAARPARRSGETAFVLWPAQVVVTTAPASLAAYHGRRTIYQAANRLMEKSNASTHGLFQDRARPAA